MSATAPPGATEVGIVVVGAHGRMGRRLVALARDYQLAVVAEVDRHGPALDIALASRARAVIDFSSPEQASATITFCRAHRIPLVLGTTGLGAEHDAALDSAARDIPMVVAPNFSIGVNVLLTLVQHAVRMLGETWDVELVEVHHRKKVDAPSGTALALAQRVAAARGEGLAEIARYGRHGDIGPRPHGELGVHAVRGGSVVGDHRLSFFGDGEEILLEHRALDRDIFARGALRAVSWLLGSDRGPGRYGMGDVLHRD